MVALLRVKLSKISSFQRAMNSDMDLLKYLSHIKDER
jgi:hypothetical protein